MIELALHLAEQGYHVFPLTPGGKTPLKGSHGCKDATRDPLVIERAFARAPDANIGIATGRVAGLLVIDVDTKDGRPGVESLRTLELPPTFTVRTASGGFHLYFQYPPGADISIGSGLLPGIDWRGESGYVVAPGSTVGGALYTIERNLEIAPTPRHLAIRLEAAKKRPRIISQDPAGRMVIPAGARNKQLHRIACMLRRFGVEAGPIVESLRAINAAHCQGLLDEAELQQIAVSAMRYAPDARELAS